MTTTALKLRTRVAALTAAATMVAAGLVLAAPSSPASADPFTCTSDFFYVAGDQLYRGSPLTPGFGTAIGAPNSTGPYNALAYNPVDDYLYAIGTSGAVQDQLLRIEDDGTVVPLGVPSGPALGGVTVAGAFDSNGTFWLASLTDMRALDIATNTYTSTWSPTFTGVLAADLVVHDDKIIRLVRKSGIPGSIQVLTLDPATQTSNETTASTIATAVGTPVAMWLSSDSRIFVAGTSGVIHEILNWESNTPSSVQRATMAQTNAGDGANCSTARSPFGIYATDDDYSGTPLLASDGGVHGSIWTNDTVDSAVATNANVATTILDEGGLVGVTIDASGSITVPGGFAPGTYYVDYQICSTAVPAECANATITILLIAGAPELAATGNETSWVAPAGAVVALLGGAALMLATRRKATSQM
jgi:LPXTG-motif cell wall-anchored protein